VRRRLLITMALALTACAASASTLGRTSSGFKQVARTTHVSYFSRSSLKVDVRRCERFLRELEKVFGPLPSGWRVGYYRHAGQAEVAAATGRYALGVTDLEGGRIHSTLGFHPHELVHAVAGRLLGAAPVFLAEGLAVALTSGGRWGDGTVDGAAAVVVSRDMRLQRFVDRFEAQDPALAYPVAGSFMAHLIDAFGIDAVLRFYSESSKSGLEAAARRAFGRSFASLNLSWAAALGGSGARVSWNWADSTSWPLSLRHSASSLGNDSRADDRGSPATVPVASRLTLGAVGR